MRGLSKCLNRAAISIIVFAFAIVANAQDKRRYVAGEVIVKLKSQSSGYQAQSFLGKASANKGMSLKRSWGRMNMYHFAAKKGQSTEQLVQELEADPNVEYVEPNYLIEKASVVGEQGISMSAEEVEQLSGGGSYLATSAPIQAMDTWGSLSTPSSKPIVAVIDTGVKIDHQVFTDSNAIWTNQNEIPGNGIDDDGNGYVDDVNGWNFVTQSGTMYDDDGHGTHVAGIVLGVGQNIYATPFAESKIQIMPLKFLDGSGVGKTSDAIQAIYYAVNNGASVLNNSWGGSSYSAALHEAVAFSYNSGVVFVAAAGNNSTNNDSAPMYPANYVVPHVMSIAATNDSDYLAFFSNYGAGSVHVGSPGQLILSTYNDGGYRSMSGTSMAAPFVSGIAALMKVESPNMLGYQVKSIIFDNADGVSQLQSKVATESRVNVLSSVNQAKVASVDASQPAYTFTNGDRELASALANAGGCGTVAKLAKDFKNGGRGGKGGGAPGLSTWYVIVLMALLAIPALVARKMRSMSPEQRRKHDRFMIDTGVTVKVGDKELTANVSSISLGGVQLNTEELLEQGGILNMTISSPDGKEQIQVEGRVVWSEENRAYGVQFNETKEKVSHSIMGWTKGLKPTN